MPRIDVTDAELAVMKLLWRRGPSTIRELSDRLYPAGGVSRYATVQKLLERLERKSCVRRRRRRPERRANVFTATIEREDLIAHRLRDTADRLCEGSLTPLLTQLVSGSRLGRTELAALRELVDRLDAEAEKP